MSQRARRVATPSEFWAIPDGSRFHELIDDELIEKATPSGEHGSAQAEIVGAIQRHFTVGGGSRPRSRCTSTTRSPGRTSSAGGASDVRATGGDTDRGSPGSLGHPTDDTVKKLRLYHRVAIPHYWLVDP